MGTTGRVAAEYIVEGTYLVTDEGLPPANNQRYTLPGGTPFSSSRCEREAETVT